MLDKEEMKNTKVIASMDFLNDDYKREKVVFYDYDEYVCVGSVDKNYSMLGVSYDMRVSDDFFLYNKSHSPKQKVYPSLATFKQFKVKSYLPKTDDKGFYTMLKEGIERIKTNYPYANPTFCSLRLPSCGIDPDSQDELGCSTGYYNLRKNLFGFADSEELEDRGAELFDIYQHELLHLCSAKAKRVVSSSNKLKTKLYADSGFQDSKGNGVGINEGLTETLTLEMTDTSSSAYYVNRRLTALLLELTPNKKQFIKKYFDADRSALDFLGDEEAVYKFTKNFDYLHHLDNLIFEKVDEEFLRIKDEKVEAYMKEHNIDDIYDAPNDDLYILDVESYVESEENLDVPYFNCDFLPNCQDILLDVAKNRLMECKTNEEQIQLISSVAEKMIMPEEVDELDQIIGAYSLHPLFIDTEKLEENREKLFNICEELGFEKDEIKSIYNETFECKETIKRHIENEDLAVDLYLFDEIKNLEEEELEINE